MKVNKATIIKLALNCGLKPIEESWEIKRINEYSRYYGGDVKTEYTLNFENEIYFFGDKYTGDNPEFYVYITHKKDYPNAILFVQMLNDNGYKTSFGVDTDGALKQQAIKLCDKLKYDDDIKKVIEMIESLVEVVE